MLSFHMFVCTVYRESALRGESRSATGRTVCKPVTSRHFNGISYRLCFQYDFQTSFPSQLNGEPSISFPFTPLRTLFLTTDGYAPLPPTKSPSCPEFRGDRSSRRASISSIFRHPSLLISQVYKMPLQQLPCFDNHPFSWGVGGGSAYCSQRGRRDEQRSGGGGEVVKTERSIALLENAKACERAGVSGKVELFVVLRDDDAAGRKERSRSKNSQHARVLFSGRIGGIEKDKIERRVVRGVFSGELFKPAESVGAQHGRAGAHTERFQVLANQRDGRRMLFDEDDFRGAAAERFDAHRACPRKNIEESRPSDCRTEHIEKSLAQTIAGGTQSKAFEAFQDAAAIGSSDDTHEIAILQTQDGELNSPLQKLARPAATNQATD